MAEMSLIRRLMAAGVPDDLVDEVADLLSDVRALEKARSKNAERQARFRAKDESGRNVTNVTSVTDVIPPASLDKETSPRPPKEINPSTRGGNALPRKAGGFSAPDGVKHETWVAFCQQRKKAVTRIAFDRIVKTLAEGADAGWPPGEIAERAVERGYETFFIPSEKPNVRNRPANDRPSGPINPMVAAGIAREARFASGGASSG